MFALEEEMTKRPVFTGVPYPPCTSPFSFPRYIERVCYQPASLFAGSAGLFTVLTKFVQLWSWLYLS